MIDLCIRSIAIKDDLTCICLVVSACDANADIVFVLDSSSSVGPPDFQKTLDFLVGMLRDANINGGNIRVGAISFSTDVHIHFYLNDHRKKKDVFKSIRAIPYILGSTNTADALQTLRTEMFNPANGDRPGVPNVAVIITDGVSNLNSERTIQEAMLTHSVGIHVFVIGIGLTGDTVELQALSTVPVEDNRFLLESFDELDEIKRAVFTQLCESKKDSWATFLFNYFTKISEHALQHPLVY